MKLGSLSVTDTMHRPGAAKVPEVFSHYRVPIAGNKDRQLLLRENLYIFIYFRYDFIPFGYAQGTSGAEIILHIHNQQGFFKFHFTQRLHPESSLLPNLLSRPLSPGQTSHRPAIPG